MGDLPAVIVSGLISASVRHLSIGTLRVITAASAPSASTQAALSCSPTWRSNVESSTPVHSEVETRPCVFCTLGIVTFRYSAPVVPEHSWK